MGFHMAKSHLSFHFRCGSDRSSVYVALSCLVQQVKTESRVDIFTAVRKLRTQRQKMVQHQVRRSKSVGSIGFTRAHCAFCNEFQNQYKFIYRAMSDYIELYKSKEEEYDYSVPVNSVNDPTVVRRANAASNGAAKKLSSPSSSQ